MLWLLTERRSAKPSLRRQLSQTGLQSQQLRSPYEGGGETYTWLMLGRSTRLRLRVSPGARSNAIVGKHGEGWKVRVTAAPADGKANAAVLRLLAERLELPSTSVMLVSGPSSRDKIVALSGIDAAEAERRLGQSR